MVGLIKYGHQVFIKNTEYEWSWTGEIKFRRNSYMSSTDDKLISPVEMTKWLE